MGPALPACRGVKPGIFCLGWGSEGAISSFFLPLHRSGPPSHCGVGAPSSWGSAGWACPVSDANANGPRVSCMQGRQTGPLGFGCGGKRCALTRAGRWLCRRLGAKSLPQGRVARPRWTACRFVRFSLPEIHVPMQGQVQRRIRTCTKSGEYAAAQAVSPSSV